MISIQNLQELTSRGATPLDRKARELALRSLEAALNAADPKCVIESVMTLKGSMLTVDKHSFDLDRFKNIYVIGGGKASGIMAETVENILGGRMEEGIVNVLHGTAQKTSRIKLHGANHPVPDKAGVEGTRRMLEIAEKATEEDLIICLISGGGSSLMPMPRGDIALADKKKITDFLLKSGATINEINTVRKHISEFKGGWFAKKAYPATILNLILSDVIGDPLDFIASGPTVPDSTTFADAIGVLKKYNIWSEASESIRRVLSEGEKGRIPETPKMGDVAFKNVYNVVVGNNRVATSAACSFLRSAGLNTVMLTAMLEGEARHVGTVLASIAREVPISGNPVEKPAGIVAGGETTVTVAGKGMGGRNQELVLASSLKLGGLDGVAVASLSTDGVDGPTDAAGAIADGRTMEKAVKSGFLPEQFLVDNDSYHFFSRLDNLVFTGPTGTNVNDVSVIVVL